MREETGSHSYPTALQLIDRFQLETSAQVKGIELRGLTRELSIFSMPITKNLCTAGGFVQGFELGVVANYAGVYLAMMNSKYFTPLCEIKKMVFLKPVVLGKDKSVYAYAGLLNMKEDLIEVNVKIINGTEIKAKGILRYKVLSRAYEV